MIYYMALLSDLSEQAKDRRKERYENLLATLTPIAKAFMTDGFEAANLGLQIFGGHGYIQEWGGGTECSGQSYCHAV